MPRLRALTSWADRKAGEEFEASDADARLLCATDAIGGQKAKLVDRAMRAADEAPPPQTSSEQTIEAKRRYLRRDLRAQN